MHRPHHVHGQTDGQNGPIDKSTFSLGHWITFRYVSGMLINGGGTFDGQGQYAWPENKCACKSLPVSLRFNFVNNTVIGSISSVNSKNFHFNLFKCDDLQFHRVWIIAPDESPNTDRIHLGYSSRIRIANSVIATGDDCVSIGPGS
ncbi:polygalacturonase-like [Rhodamnia argentea]|uniref:Polygalacturonase-like n=1 Tax=Rhodamnia argentea TaxID=178133 RepID=A0A8B8QZT3_9MYRT|nr:polygalacturonase-like [Rhodamnia argentea]